MIVLDICDMSILADESFDMVLALGSSEERERPFVGGRFATTYLSPGDYHRVHMPLSGHLIEMTYIPGRLFSVAPDYIESVLRLFVRNERVACIFETVAGLWPSSWWGPSSLVSLKRCGQVKLYRRGARASR